MNVAPVEAVVEAKAAEEPIAETTEPVAESSAAAVAVAAEVAAPIAEAPVEIKEEPPLLGLIGKAATWVSGKISGERASAAPPRNHSPLQRVLHTSWLRLAAWLAPRFVPPRPW